MRSYAFLLGDELTTVRADVVGDQVKLSCSKKKARDVSLVLPSATCGYRSLELPPLPEKDLPSAVECELLAALPGTEREICWGFARWPQPSGVAAFFTFSDTLGEGVPGDVSRFISLLPAQLAVLGLMDRYEEQADMVLLAHPDGVELAWRSPEGRAGALSGPAGAGDDLLREGLKQLEGSPVRLLRLGDEEADGGTVRRGASDRAESVPRPEEAFDSSGCAELPEGLRWLAFGLLCAEKLGGRHDMSPPAVAAARKKRRILRELQLLAFSVLFLMAVALLYVRAEIHAVRAAARESAAYLREETGEIRQLRSRLEVLRTLSDMEVNTLHLLEVLRVLHARLPSSVKLASLDYRENGRLAIKGQAPDMKTALDACERLREAFPNITLGGMTSAGKKQGCSFTMMVPEDDGDAAP